MPVAGEYTDPGRISGRIATNIVTTNSSTVTTTETTVQSVTAALVSGRTYRVRWIGAILTSQASVYTRCRIREDNATGTQLQIRIPQTGSDATVSVPVILEAEYTAVSTGNKTFVFTIIRDSGSGTHQLQAGAGNPAYLYVDYIRG